MEKRLREIRGCNFDGGLNTLINEEDLHDEEHPPAPRSNQSRQKASMYILTPWRHCGLPAVSLALLAVILLIVNICLGVHYKNVKAQNSNLNDTEHISQKLTKLQDTHKSTSETIKVYKKRLQIEKDLQRQTTWEFDHQTKRSRLYEDQFDQITKDIAAMRYNLPMIKDGCKYCPAGWILVNSVCYYFPFPDHDGMKSWQKARDFCHMYGGDLAVIDSKEKENFTVNHLRFHLGRNSNMGFWFGLKDSHEEGTWKWLDGTILVEGYWNAGEPNDINDEDCAGVYPRENFFMAWNDVSCDATMKWICEKAPTSMN